MNDYTKFNILGVELEFDFLDLDEKEFFESVFSETNKKISSEVDDKDFSIENARKYCESIISLFEELFGEEKTYDIFSGKCNLMKCTAAIKELIKAKLEQDKAFATELKSVTTISEEVFGEEEISLNRQQRRAIERNKKKYN
jgi:hypothetical protein